MKTSLRVYIAAFLAALGFSMPSAATTSSTDYTDLWLVPAEAGWGLNLIHQGDTIFASLFVFGPDKSPRWYFASGMTGTANAFSGQLFRATGTNFSSPWNTADRTTVPVGNMTVAFTNDSTGTLSYSVDGATVAKTIVRYVFKNNNLSGSYVGGMTAITNSCQNSANNGAAALIAGFMDVTHNATGNVSFKVDFNVSGGPTAGQAATCTFSGAYTQQGKIGTIPNGTWSCTGGAVNSGTFSMQQIDARIAGLNALITAQDAACRYVGYFGGVTDVQ